MRKGYCGLLFCVLVMLFASNSLLTVKANSTESEEVCAALTTADHERDWFKERTTHTALLPEVHFNVTPTSRTSFGRQRTLAKQAQQWVATRVIAGSQMALAIVCRTSTPGNTSLAKDYYIYALRHIII